MSVRTCTHCGQAIHESVDVCPHCGEQQPELPGPPPDPNLELVPVFQAGDAGIIALAKSLLEGEGIEYMARGEMLQDLFGGGRIIGFNSAVGPVEFVVRSDDASRARVLLQDLASTGDGLPSEEVE